MCGHDTKNKSYLSCASPLILESPLQSPFSTSWRSHKRDYEPNFFSTYKRLIVNPHSIEIQEFCAAHHEFSRGVVLPIGAFSGGKDIPASQSQ